MTHSCSPNYVKHHGILSGSCKYDYMFHTCTLGIWLTHSVGNECTKVQNPQHHACANSSKRMHYWNTNRSNVHTQFPKWPTAIQCRKWCISVMEQFQKIPHIFCPLLPIEYVISFLGWTDAPEVRSRLTNTHTHRPHYSNPCCACMPRVNNMSHMYVYLTEHHTRFCSEAQKCVSMCNLMDVNFSCSHILALMCSKASVDEDK